MTTTVQWLEQISKKREQISKKMGWWMPLTSTDNSRGFDAYPEKTDKVLILLQTAQAETDKAARIDELGMAIQTCHDDTSIKEVQIILRNRIADLTKEQE